MSKINEVFESVYSDITEFDKKYFKTHGRYFRTDTVIAFGGFKEALRYKDPEIKKLRDALRLVTNGLSVNQRGIAMDVISDIDVFYLLSLIKASE